MKLFKLLAHPLTIISLLLLPSQLSAAENCFRENDVQGFAAYIDEGITLDSNGNQIPFVSSIIRTRNNDISVTLDWMTVTITGLLQAPRTEERFNVYVRLNNFHEEAQSETLSNDMWNKLTPHNAQIVHRVTIGFDDEIYSTDFTPSGPSGGIWAPYGRDYSISTFGIALSSVGQNPNMAQLFESKLRTSSVFTIQYLLGVEATRLGDYTYEWAKEVKFTDGEIRQVATTLADLERDYRAGQCTPL